MLRLRPAGCLACAAGLVFAILGAGDLEEGRAQATGARATAEQGVLGHLAKDLAAQADALRRSGKYREALPLAERAMAIVRQLDGDEHPNYAMSLNDLANLYFALQEYKKAEPLYQQALEIGKDFPEEKAADFAMYLNNLAELYGVLKEYGKAEPLYRQAAEIRKKALGESHPDYVRSLNGLADVYASLGEYAKAEPLYRQVAEIRKKTLGESHPDYAASLNELARAYCSLKEYAKAEPLYRQALEIHKRAIGEDAEYATILNNLAVCYYSLKDYTKAEPPCRKAAGIQKEVLGEEHPDYATSLNDLGGIYEALGDYAKAGPLYRQAAAIRKKVLGEEHPDYATSLNDLADVYESLGEYAKAEPLYREAAEIRKKALGESHPKYARSLSGLADVHYSLEEYAKAEPLYRQALDIRKKALSEDHPDYAVSLSSLANVYYSLKEYRKAEPLYRQAMEIRRNALGVDHPSHLRSLRDLAGVYYSLEEYAKAEPLYRQATAIRKKVLGEEHPDYAASLNDLGRVYEPLGEYAKAESLYRQAAAIRKKVLGEEHPDYASSLNDLANVYQLLGELAKAEPLYRRALDIRKKVLGENHCDYASTLNGLAVLYASLGEYAEAEPLYRKALEIWRASLGEDDPSCAAALNNLAGVYESLERFAEAETRYRQALDIYKRTLGERADYADCLSNLAALYRSREEYAKAEPLDRRALEIRKSTLGEDHPDYATSLHLLAVTYESLGEHGKAEPLYRQALDIRKRVLGEKHPDYVSSLIDLADFYDARGEYAKAEPLAREGLRRENEHAAAVVAFLPEARAMTFGEDLWGCDLLLDILRKTPAAAAPDAYRVLWESRAPVSHAVERRRKAAASTPEAQSLASQLQAISEQLAQTTLAPVGPSRRDVRRKRLAELNAQKEKLEAELARVEASSRHRGQVATTGPQDLAHLLADDLAVVEFYRGLARDPSPGGRRLAREPHYQVFVVRRGKATDDARIAWIHLGPADAIDAFVAAWRASLAGTAGPDGLQVPSLSKSAAKTAAPPRSPQHVLRERIWDKIEPHLAGCSAVTIIPDGELCFLPWAALPGREPGTCLIEDYALATASSGPQLCALRSERRSAQGGVLLVGDVQYNSAPSAPPDPAMRLAATSAPGSRRTRGPAIKGRPTWLPLPGTAQEIDDVERLWPAQLVPVVLRGSAAGETAIRQRLPGSRFVHLATHGFFADEHFRSMLGHDLQGEQLFGGPDLAAAKSARVTARNPLILSGVVLAGANLPPRTDPLGLSTGEDGILTAEEIVNLDLRNTELVVLSACDTGLGRVAGGEGIMGLTRAFHLAGARNVIASLWKVDDDATAALMRLFYEKLWREGKPPLAALREAQLTIYRHPERISELGRKRAPDLGKTVELPNGGRRSPQARTAPPRLWAGFVLSGPGN